MNKIAAILAMVVSIGVSVASRYPKVPEAFLSIWGNTEPGRRDSILNISAATGQLTAAVVTEIDWLYAHMIADGRKLKDMSSVLQASKDWYPILWYLQSLPDGEMSPQSDLSYSLFKCALPNFKDPAEQGAELMYSESGIKRCARTDPNFPTKEVDAETGPIALPSAERILRVILFNRKLSSENLRTRPC
ncbi:MAG: hypothetical protein LBJ92_01825 [Holosporales bacterium]|nr:hypothetical protein [Holosporales bacterium]